MKALPENMVAGQAVPGGHQQLLARTQAETMSELYSHLYEELELRLAEAELVGT